MFRLCVINASYLRFPNAIFSLQIINTPDGENDPPENMFWCNYFEKKSKKFWIAEKRSYIIDKKDIISDIKPPNIHMAGSRMSYTFDI